MTDLFIYKEKRYYELHWLKEWPISSSNVTGENMFLFFFEKSQNHNFSLSNFDHT